jgi:hypothetical protein
VSAPWSDADGLEPYDDFVLRSLGIADSTGIIALVITPSFRPPWALLLVRGRGARPVLRVTRLSHDVWASMLSPMSELQGPSVYLGEAEQRRALADISVDAATVERPIDRATASLFVALWQALTSRTQVVESDVMTLDGTGYTFFAGGRTGTIASPDYGSVLERSTYIAERLGRFVEYPSADDLSDLVYVREELKEALARTRDREPCLRRVER